MMKRSVVKMFDETQSVGYVVGLTFYNNNGSTKTFQSEWQMNNWLKSFWAIIK